MRDHPLILLRFQPLKTGSPVLVRATHFRICSDGTLRGPDNTIAARYFGRLWHLAQQRHALFECTGPIYLRVTHCDGRRDSIGPYASLRAAGGAIFSDDSRIGLYAACAQSSVDTTEMWEEISFVTSPMVSFTRSPDSFIKGS